MFYVVEGPAGAGNQMGYFSQDLVPEGGFIVACDCDEYANGGSGPKTADGVLYKSRARAEQQVEQLEQERCAAMTKK